MTVNSGAECASFLRSLLRNDLKSTAAMKRPLCRVHSGGTSLPLAGGSSCRVHSGGTSLPLAGGSSFRVHSGGTSLPLARGELPPAFVLFPDSACRSCPLPVGERVPEPLYESPAVTEPGAFSCPGAAGPVRLLLGWAHLCHSR